MDVYLLIAIAIANIIAIAIVYQFIKKLEKREIIIFLAISIATMYILISIVYWISGFGIDESVHEASKNFVLYLFVPVNMILFVPFIASKYVKLKSKEIKKQKLVDVLKKAVVLLIIVLIIEYFYFRNIQTNINETRNSIQNEQKTNKTATNEIENNVSEIISNIVETNEITSSNIIN